MNWIQRSSTQSLSSFGSSTRSISSWSFFSPHVNAMSSPLSRETSFSCWFQPLAGISFEHGYVSCIVMLCDVMMSLPMHLSHLCLSANLIEVHFSTYLTRLWLWLLFQLFFSRLMPASQMKCDVFLWIVTATFAGLIMPYLLRAVRYDSLSSSVSLCCPFCSLLTSLCVCMWSSLYLIFQWVDQGDASSVTSRVYTPRHPRSVNQSASHFSLLFESVCCCS